MLFEHLLVDRIDVLFAPGDHRFNAGGGQAFFDFRQHLVDAFTPVAAGRLHRLDKHPVAVRMQILEGQFVHLAKQAVQAEAIGNGRVNLDGFPRHAVSLLRAHRIERAHIVQTVGQLDQHDAHIARHGQQHLSEIFGFGFRGRLRFQAVELGDTVHQVCNRLAKARADFVLGDGGVFHHVVQQRRHDGLRIQLPIGNDLRDSYRVRDIGIAALAPLPVVGGVAELIGFFDQADIGRPEISQCGAKIGNSCGSHDCIMPRDGLLGKLAIGESAGDAGATALLPGNQEVWTRARYSMPTLPAATSRKATTVGLSRPLSTMGVPPCASWRAR